MAASGLGERLKEARLAASFRLSEKLSQERMAELVGEELGRVLQPTQWRRYETGKREAPLDVIDAAAAVSGLDRSYIAFGGERRAPIADGFVRTDVPDTAPAASPKKKKGR